MFLGSVNGPLNAPAGNAYRHRMTETQAPQSSQPWHSLPHDEAMRRLNVGQEGLAIDEAEERLGRHGPNVLPPPRRAGPLLRFLKQFDNVLIYALIAAAAISAGLGEIVDASVILGVVVINAAIGFVQESRAENALSAIEGLLAPEAQVLRRGQIDVVPARALVPGDIVVLRSGDKVPADMRLIEALDLHLEEAALTGESASIEKSREPVPVAHPLPERRSMVYAGTLVAQGIGRGVVVATGPHMEIGRIGAALAGIERLETPLLRQMSLFGRRLTLAIGVAAALTFAIGVWLRDLDMVETFMAAVGLAVAAIPEGLPAVLSITLAIGVTRMARQRALVRRLPAVETLGAVTVICSDKTGTLTTNEQTLSAVLTAAGEQRLPIANPHAAPLPETLERALVFAAICNDAAADAAALGGNAVDAALVRGADAAGLDVAGWRALLPRRAALPFDSSRKYMATAHEGASGEAFRLIKGAPERILLMCDRLWTPVGRQPLDRATWSAALDRMSSEGARVIGLAWFEGAGSLESCGPSSGGALVGLFAMIDPPRPEAIAAVEICRGAGIEVKMITGDHLGTAQAIGERFGLGAAGRSMSGVDIDAMGDEELSRAVRRTEIFARTTPDHKLRLVRALQSQGEVVAMTGDGVNDAPALKQADIGIAMGRKGTEAAREAAEMVLTDDNFATIAAAVRAGRNVYDNIRKSMLLILPTNGGEALIVMTAIVFGLALPISPIQVLWINMVTAVTLGLALAFEPPEKDVMARPPRPPDEGLLTPFLVWRIGFVSLLMLAATLIPFLHELSRHGDLALARSVAVNAVVAAEIGYLLNCRRLLASMLAPGRLFETWAPWISIALVLVAQVALTHFQPLQRLFEMQHLTPGHWGLVAAVAVAVFLCVEIEKAVWRRLSARAPTN